MPNQDQLPSIELLSEHIIDQIKAGEVIERASSLIKEILENSIDARATSIELKIINNGLDLIMLKDNGIGMSFDQLPFAFCRHATSKLKSFEALYSLRSFGFRGEALASIASVAKIKCSSQPINDEKSGQISIHGGETLSHIELPKQSEHGTTLVIKELFFNTPARLKFVKSFQSEKNAIKRIIHSFILSHPSISFSIEIDGKIVRFNGVKTEDDFKQRVIQIIGKKKSIHTDELLIFQDEWDGYAIKGIIPKDPSSFYDREQYLFVRGRLFTDRTIHQLILREAPSLWNSSSGPYILFIDVPTNEIDVNVHPSKTMIKFFKLSALMGLIKGSFQKTISNQKKILLQESSESLANYPTHQTTQNSDTQLKLSSSLASDNHLDHKSELNLKLNDDTLIYYEQGLTYLVSLKEIFKSLIGKLKSISPIDESKTIPLLVASIGISKKTITNAELDLLKDLGFESEKLSDCKIVLRSIPDELRIFPPKEILRMLISLLIDHDFQSHYFDLSNPEINSLLLNADWTFLKTTKALIEITNETFEQHFRS